MSWHLLLVSHILGSVKVSDLDVLLGQTQPEDMQMERQGTERQGKRQRGGKTKTKTYGRRVLDSATNDEASKDIDTRSTTPGCEGFCVTPNIDSRYRYHSEDPNVLRTRSRQATILRTSLCL
jgi:hypothetical protein